MIERLKWEREADIEAMKQYSVRMEQQEKIREEELKEKEKWMHEWMSWMADTVMWDKGEKDRAEEMLLL